MRILCIEDNETLSAILAAGLRQAGFSVDVVPTAEDALSAIAAVRYDAMVLDLNLPDLDGMVLLRKLRAGRNSAPILILSARNSTDDRIAGLNAGADDYLQKPFDIAEVAARLRALLRRPNDMLSPELKCGNLAFRPESHTAVVDGREHALPRREASVLEHLLRSAGRPVPKSSIEDRMYAFGAEVASNAVEVYIHFLRKRLAAMGADVKIETIRGTGYVLSRPKQVATRNRLDSAAD